MGDDGVPYGPNLVCPKWFTHFCLTCIFSVFVVFASDHTH